MELKQHIALRTCIATGEKKDKKDMIRLVKLQDGSVIVDLKGKGKGRGASISTDLISFDSAVKKKSIERALKLEKKLSPEALEKLRNEFMLAIEEKELRAGKRSIAVKVAKEDFDKINSLI